MSMLAERKQKQRWSLNPRGKQWSEDSSKFGQKLLEKMGWKHGKGLGANEDGLTEHVKLNYKNDQKGMGYKETEQWTEHDDHFTQLLNTLNGDLNDNSKTDEVKLSSLHEKAENIKTRINYHKFTKGKDLSRYSEKDLANIFGRKNLKKEKHKIEEKINDENDLKNDVEEGNLINKGSITDYFKRKLPQFGKIGDYGVKIGNNGVLTKDNSDSESEKCFGFGFNNNSVEEQPKMIDNDVDDSSKLEMPEKKKKKKNKNSISFQNDAIKNNFLEENVVVKKKKMKNQETEEKIISEDIVNEEKFHLNGFNEDEKCKKKKKKSKKNKICEEEEIQEKIGNDEANITLKKKKKKDKISEEVESKNKNDENEEVNEIGDKTEITSKKKKKKNKKSNNQTDNEQNEEANVTSKNKDLNPSNKRKLSQEIEEISLEPPLKKKKSKKSKNNPQLNNELSSGITNPAFDPNFNQQKNDLEVRKRTKVIIEYENDDSSIKNEEKSIKIKKIEKKEIEGIINPSFEDLLPTVKNKNPQDGIDNPSLNIIEEDCDLTLNVVTTPILKSERSIARTRKSVRFSKSNKEHIIPNNYMRERNELFDINTLVVEESIKEELKNRENENNGFVNNGFDIRTIDKLSFFDTDVKGIDNPCFQPKNLEDKVNEMSQRVENFEAKLDNDINEYKSSYQDVFVGCNDVVEKHMEVSEGVRLSFKNVNFGKNPPWMTRAETSAKKSYKHLIKGDIIVAFKRSNLHQINGYGVQKK